MRFLEEFDGRIGVAARSWAVHITIGVRSNSRLEKLRSGPMIVNSSLTSRFWWSCRSTSIRKLESRCSGIRYDKQKLFFDRFKTSHKITCASPIQKNYYTLKEATNICYQCISDLNDQPDILEKIVKAKELYSVVLPSCLSVACGKFKTANPKRPKRPAPRARPKPAAKRRRGGKGWGFTRVSWIQFPMMVLVNNEGNTPKSRTLWIRRKDRWKP